MRISHTHGSGSSEGSGTGKISGGGNAFKLPSIKEQFNKLNEKFNVLRSGGQHDPHKRRELLSSVENLEKHPHLDDAMKKSLDAMKAEILAMEKEAIRKKE